jgi:hypothetical protein
MRDFQLAAEQPALGVDLLDRKIDSIFPVVADGGTAAGQFGDISAPCANAATDDTVASRSPAKIPDLISIPSSRYNKRPCDRPRFKPRLL